MLGFLENFAAGFWDFLRKGVGLVLPFFSQEKEYKGMTPTYRRTLHIILLLIIVLVLFGVSYWLDLGRYLLAPTIFGIPLRNLWLSILFLLVYALFWLGYWLLKLMGPEEKVSEFPDIDAAWEDACAALQDKGIALADAPLFLILGRPSTGETSLFDAAQLKFLVSNVPSSSGAPVHVFANRDGIYVTCTGASLLGQLSRIVAGEAGDSIRSPAASSLDNSGGEDEDAQFKTLAPKGRLKSVQNILAAAREEGRGPDQLSDQERAEIRGLVAEEEAAQKRAKARPSLIKNNAMVDRCQARFRHFCRLIVRDRRPFCPINGILAVLPIAVTDSEEEANQAIALCHQELSMAKAELQMACPLFAMISDLETVPGFGVFFEQFPADQRQRRMGQRFPLVPDLEDSKVPALVEEGVEWICEGIFPAWIYKQFRVETDGEKPSSIVDSNIQLFKFLQSLQDRRQFLGRVVARGLATQSQTFFLGGCYVAGTSREAAAFIPGVFRRLTEHQSAVAWTPQALNEDADYQRWAQYGYIGMGVLTALVVVLFGLRMFFPKK